MRRRSGRRDESVSALLDSFRIDDPRLPRDVVVLLGASVDLPAEVVALDRTDPTGARGLLRSAAAELLGITPAEVALHPPRTRQEGLWRPPRQGRAGAVSADRRSVRVSLSRAGGIVAVAVSRRQVGIDVEALQSPEQAADLLEVLHPADRRAISPDAEESSVLDAAAAESCALEITGAWTRIEAYLKLRGTGLRRDPSTVRVGRTTCPRVPGRAKVLTRLLTQTPYDPAASAPHGLSISIPHGLATSARPTHLCSIVWI